MSASSGPSIRISPNQSRLTLRFLSAAHVLALVGALANGLPLPVRLALVVLITISWVLYLRRVQSDYAKNRPFIIYGEQAGWTIQIGQTPPIKAELLGSSVATRWVIILHFKTAGSEFRSILILPDCLDAEDFRQLRMLLTIAKKRR